MSGVGTGADTPHIAATPDTVYLIYTSGTTGRPGR